MKSQSERVLIALVILNVALQVFDGMATYWGLQVGFGEANHLVRWAMGRFGTVEALCLFKLYASGCILAVWLLRRSPLALPALALTAAVYVVCSFGPWTAAIAGLHLMS